jgi:mannose-6-phosphate isomerase-like protein (cupin superfamily)
MRSIGLNGIFCFKQATPKEMEKVNLTEKLSTFSDHWNPKIVGDLNGQQAKLVKFKGEFVWHHHEVEDEMFLVVRGEFCMEFREPSGTSKGARQVHLQAGEFIIVPHGVEHRPVAQEEVHVLLFEPATTLNTGNTQGDLTVAQLQRI